MPDIRQQGRGEDDFRLKLTFRSGGTFRFSYKVSSESNYDYMAVTKNGTNLTQSSKASYSGAMTSFQTYTMEVAANDVVTIGYSKGVVFLGDDAFLDNLLESPWI